MFTEQELELVVTGIAVQIRMVCSGPGYDPVRDDTNRQNFYAWYDAHPEEAAQISKFIHDSFCGFPLPYPKWSQDADLIVKTNQRILFNDGDEKLSSKATEVLNILVGNTD